MDINIKEKVFLRVNYNALNPEGSNDTEKYPCRKIPCYSAVTVNLILDKFENFYNSKQLNPQQVYEVQKEDLIKYLISQTGAEDGIIRAILYEWYWSVKSTTPTTPNENITKIINSKSQQQTTNKEVTTNYMPVVALLVIGLITTYFIMK